MQGLYNDDLALQNATAAQARAYVEWYLSRDRAHAQSKSPVVVARVNTICVLGKGDQSCEPGRISRARFLVSIKTGQTPWSKVKRELMASESVPNFELSYRFSSHPFRPTAVIRRSVYRGGGSKEINSI